MVNCLMEIRTTLFQSSPDPLAGRYFTFEVSDRHDVLFQSSPDPLAGRYQRLIEWLTDWQVSILARPSGRALHAVTRRQVAGRRLFQSSPDPLAGRYVELRGK